MPEPPSRLDNLRTLRHANLDMAFYTVFVTLAGGAFLVGFTQVLCREAGVKPDAWIGWLSAIPSLAGILQIPGAVWGRRHASYKSFVAPGWMLWRLFYIPVAMLPFLPMLPSVKLWTLASCLVLSWGIVYIVNPVFFDWLAELVPHKSRGWYFSLRNGISAGVGAAVGYLGGVAIDAFKGAKGTVLGLDTEHFGYGVVFSIAVVFALIGQFGFFNRMHDLNRTRVVREKLSDSVAGFKAVVFDRQFRAVLLFMVIFIFGQTFAGGFFTAYAFESLGMSFQVLQLAALVQAAGNMIAAPIWGMLADKYGNKPMLAIAGAGMVLTPVPWLLCFPGQTVHNAVILISAHLFIGMAWSGVGICQFNLLLSTAREEMRANCLGVGMAIQGLVGGVAPLVGAAAMSMLRPETDAANATAWAYKLLFMITMGLRLVSVLAIGPVREPGSVRVIKALRDISRTTPQGLRALRRLRNSASVLGRQKAIRKVSSERIALAEDDIVTALHDPSPRVRREAAVALGKLGRSRAAVEGLIHMLEEHPDLVEEETVEALGELEDARAVEPLIRYLQNSRLMVRRAAARALGQIGSEKAIPALTAAARQSDAPVFRRAGIQALSALGATEAAEVVAAALLDTQPIVRIAAAEAVAELELKEAATQLRESLSYYNDEASAEAAYALGAVGEPTDIPAILQKAAACESIITRHRCLLGVARLLDVEDEAYGLLLQEGMNRDRALEEKLRESKETLAALETYSLGDEPGAVRHLIQAFPEAGLEALADNPVKDAFIVAACAAARSRRDA